MSSSSSSSAPRVLLSGDVLGRLPILFKRVCAVNKSNGPFDFLLCVGQFFPDDPELLGEFMDFVEGRREVPIPTYFIGDYGVGAAKILAAATRDPANLGFKTDGVKVCHNLYWLKGSGRFVLHNLFIAYLSGRCSSKGQPTGVYGEDDIDALRALAEEPGITDLASPDVLSSAGTDAIVSELAAEIKPRYHIAGTKGVFYAREPYTNKAAVHVTRFLGLAAVGNTSKQKFIHALSPTPACKMSDAEIRTAPPNTTLSPYTVAEPQNICVKELERPRDDDAQHWRYDVSRKRRRSDTEDGKKVCFNFVSTGSCSRGEKCDFHHDVEAREQFFKGACFDFIIKGKCERGQECKFLHSLSDENQRHGDHAETGAKGGRLSSRSSHCWFCLSSPNLESHLILSVGDAFYCALAKGPLVEDHVLLLPIEHVHNTLSVHEGAEVELLKFKSAIKAYLRSQGMALIVFEFISNPSRTTHANLQVVPLPLSKASEVRQHFISAAKNLGFEFSVYMPTSEVDARQELRTQLDRSSSFFYLELAEGSILSHSIGDNEKFPVQFGREVLAGVLNQKDRADWRKCKLSKEEEIQMAEDFKKGFEEFDPNR
ncbi:Zinc finger CCCH domain-containing protein 64 [Nymphaea thermarum]|nr:Zinc finger CCCH domain-containing protein 64 [Nymphaea thermarum]